MRPRLALGTAQLGLDYGVANRTGRPGLKDAIAILRAAVEAGVRYLDTAAAYGEAEERVGRFLSACGRPDGLRIGTKLSRLAGGLTPREMNRQVAAAVDGSCTRLGVDQLDDLLLHSAENPLQYGADLVAALTQQRDRGRVERIGVSGYAVADCATVLDHDAFTVMQVPVSVLDQRFVTEGAIARLRSDGRTVLARSVLLQGLLTLEPDQGEARVPGAGRWLAQFRQICSDHGVEPVAAAMGFAAERSGADYLIVGVESPAQLEQVVGLMDRPLSEPLLDQLALAFRAVPEEVRDPRRWPIPA